MFKKPERGEFTPTDALFHQLETLRRFRSGGGGVELDDDASRLFADVLGGRKKPELIGAINDLLYALAAPEIEISQEQFDLLVRALNTTFGRKPDLMSDEPEE